MSRSLPGLALTLALLAAPAPAAPKPADAKPDTPTELHVVALYEPGSFKGGRLAGGTVPVQVDRPGVDVTLVLSAYEPVAWQVTATPKTNVVKVILAGYHRQAAEVPKGAKVDELFHEGREGKAYLKVDYKADGARFRPAVQELKALTKMEVQSFQGAYRYDPARPLVVDRVQDDPRLSSDFPHLSRLADLPKVKFQGVLLTPAGRDGASGAFGDFTQAGPDKATLKALPDKVVRLAYDPKGKKYYGLTMHELHEVDLGKKTSTKIEPPGPGLPQLSWPRALTFDTKRERLLVIASKAVFEYAGGKWALVAELPRGTDVVAAAYHPKDDTLYAIAHSFGEEPRPLLVRMNANGAVLKATELKEPLFPGALGRRGMERRGQLVSAGTHLALLVGGPLPPDDNGKPGKAESFLFLIDPEDDKVTLGWKE